MKVRRYFKGNSLLILRFQVGVYIFSKNHISSTPFQNEWKSCLLMSSYSFPPPQIIKNKYTPQTQTQPDMKEEKI